MVQKHKNHLPGQNAGSPLRLSGDLGLQLITESVFGLALGIW